MEAEDIILELALAGDVLPARTMKAAAADWDRVAPAMLGVLESYVGGGSRGDEASNALFFILHVMGQVGERRAFGPLCRLCMEPEAVYAVLGEGGVHESLKQILISTWDGDLDMLKAVVEQHDGDEYVRFNAFEVLAYLAATGGADRDGMRGYLLRLHDTMQPQGESFAWTGWVWAIGLLGMGELEPAVEVAFRRGFVPRDDMSLDDFRRMVARATSEDGSGGLAAFREDNIRPMGDAVKELSSWDTFSKRGKRARAARQGRETVSASLWHAAVNPHRTVGRNDPCPCGSGRKFKKCCLH